MIHGVEFDHIRLWRGKQGLFGECIATASSGQYRFRGLIERDSYDFQCKWKAYAWTASGWQYVLAMNPDESRLFRHSYARSGDDWKDAAERDLGDIVSKAMNVWKQVPRKEAV